MAEDLYRNLAQRDGRYSYEAFRFLNESLAVAVRLAGKDDLDGARRVLAVPALSPDWRAEFEARLG